MRRNYLIRVVFCLGLLSATTTQAQDLKSILGEMAQTVLGGVTTTAESIVGTWDYTAPDCQFQSDNLLAAAGGQTAALKVEKQLDKAYRKLGLPGSSLVLGADGAYSFEINGKSSSGNYAFDSETKTLTLTTKLGISVKAQVSVTGSSMSLLFNADKLMSALTTLTGLAAKVNSNAAVLNSLAANYDGLLLGMKMTAR